MKLRIRKIGSHVDGFHSSKRNKLVLKLQRTSDKAQREQKRAEKEERQSDQRAARISLYPPGTVLNKSGTLVGMAPGNTDAARRKITGMRRFYNKKMPVLQCNGCSFANSCPKFKAGYECAFLPMLNAHKVESMDDLREYMREMSSAAMRRVHLKLTGETIMGASPSLETTEMMALAFQMLKDTHKMEEEAGTAEIEVEGDESILGQLFGNLKGLVRETKHAHVKRLNEEPPPVRAPKRKDVIIEVPADELTDATGAIQPGVDLDLVQAFNTDQLLSRTRGKRRQSTAQPVISVSASKV